MEQGADQAAQDFVVGLQDSTEHVIVGHVIRNFSVSVLQHGSEGNGCGIFCFVFCHRRVSFVM